MRGVLVTAVVCLAVGVGVLFAFCHGTTGFSFDTPVSAASTSLHIDITTTGLPAIIGLGFTVLGAFLLIIATLIALVGMLRLKNNNARLKRRETAFEE